MQELQFANIVTGVKNDNILFQTKKKILKQKRHTKHERRPLVAKRYISTKKFFIAYSVRLMKGISST